MQRRLQRECDQKITGVPQCRTRKGAIVVRHNRKSRKPSGDTEHSVLRQSADEKPSPRRAVSPGTAREGQVLRRTLRPGYRLAGCSPALPASFSPGTPRIRPFAILVKRLPSGDSLPTRPAENHATLQPAAVHNNPVAPLFHIVATGRTDSPVLDRQRDRRALAGLPRTGGAPNGCSRRFPSSSSAPHVRGGTCFPNTTAPRGRSQN